MAVDYTPTLGNYKELKPFRYWCQKVLPLVYDDSLSYYELLCKVVDYLNKTMEDVDTLHDDVDALADAYDQLQTYVNNYFDNLDVQTEINTKLDAMASSGALSALVAPFIPDLVTAWLDKNITPTTPVIDDTLTVSGAGADAKVTGTMLLPINNSFHPGNNLFNPLDTDTGYVLTNAGAVRNEPTGYTSNYIPVIAGETYQKRYRFDSSVIADVVYYNSSREYLGYERLPSNRMFTPPANTSYIRITGYISNMNIEYLYNTKWGTSIEQKYRKILSPTNGGGDHVRIIANQSLFIDASTTPWTIKKIASSPNTTFLYVQIPGMPIHSIALPVSINGTGSYLWYDYTTKTFYANSDYYTSDAYPNRYFVCNVANTENEMFILKSELFNIVSAKPILYADIFNRTLTIKIDTSVYMLYKNSFTTLTQETYVLNLSQNISDITLIYFDLSTNKFIIGNNFLLSETTLKYLIPIGYIFGGEISSIIPIANVYTELTDKIISTFGDSLTWYDGHEFTWGEDEGDMCYGFQSHLRQFYKAHVINYGVSGTTTPQICTRLKDNISNIGDNTIVTIMGGDNDDRLNVSVGTIQTIGSAFNTDTIYGALQDAIETVLASKPTVKIVLMTEPMGWTYRNNVMVPVNENIPKAYRDVAELYNIPIIDIWKHSGVNAITVDAYYCDPVDNHLYKYHPNNIGWARISNQICNELLKV